MTSQGEEARAIAIALAAWVDSQDAPQMESVVAMVALSGMLIGAHAGNIEDLELGLLMFTELLVRNARGGFERNREQSNG